MAIQSLEGTVPPRRIAEILSQLANRIRRFIV